MDERSPLDMRYDVVSRVIEPAKKAQQLAHESKPQFSRQLRQILHSSV